MFQKYCPQRYEFEMSIVEPFPRGFCTGMGGASVRTGSGSHMSLLAHKLQNPDQHTYWNAEEFPV